MEAYSGGRVMKQESGREATDSPSDRRGGGVGGGMGGDPSGGDQLLDMSAQIQQLLAASSASGGAGGALLSPIQFLQAGGGAGGALPWGSMLPQYQMMFLAGQNASGGGLGEDGGHVVMVTDKDGRGGTQQQFLDAATLQLLQQQLSAAAAGDTAAAIAQLGASAPVDQPQQRARPVGQQQDAGNKPAVLRPPPKKPLTPYMMFSKSIWPQVKAANSHLSAVTEIGAIVGSLWRELGSAEKLQYNEQFTRDKMRYDEELRAYLRTNGLHPSDLIKARTKKVPRGGGGDHKHPPTQHRPPPAPAAPPAVSHAPQATQQRGGSAAAAAAAAEALPNFSQAWAAAGGSGGAGGGAAGSMQQLLAQLGLTGQVYANSDGTISVDTANLANLLALQPQLLQQTQLLTDAASVVGPPLKQAKLEPSAADNGKSWPWSQSPSEGGGGGAQSSPHPNGSAPNGPADDPSGGASTQYPEYYTVNEHGQLVKHTTSAEAPPPAPSGGPRGSLSPEEAARRVAELERELGRAQAALLQRDEEVERLRADLNEALRLINECRQQHGGGTAGGRGGPSTSAG